MNRSHVLTALFLVGSAGLCQTADKAPTTMFSTVPTAQSFCPLEIKAAWTKPSGTIGLRRIDSGSDQSQSLEVTLKNSQSLAVRRSQITVYGFPPGAHAEPAVLYSLGANPLEVAKSFTFDRAIEPGQSTAIDLSIADVETITGINLDSLTYADGSSWRPQFRYPCQALSGRTEQVPTSLR